MLDNVRWIRLLYTHPAHFTDSLIEEYAENPKLCAYVDLPLQHLHDEMLQRMGRRVTQAQCLDLIDRLRDRVPGIALRTTFIVGFPGESDAHFGELLRCVHEIQFDHLGAFAYSAEPDTRAAAFPDPVSPSVTEERIEALMLEQQAIVFEQNQAMVGQTVEVLIDGPTDDEEVWIGRTAFQAPDVDSVTFVEGADCQPGAFVEAQIIGSQDYDLIARI
jgi:ribosomal protein S12 methylthiotransferase